MAGQVAHVGYSTPAMSHTHHSFSKRRHLLTNPSDAFTLAADIRRNLAGGDHVALGALLESQHPADLADTMRHLDPAEERAVFALLSTVEAAEVLDEVDSETERNLVAACAPDALATIVRTLPTDEAADVLGGIPSEERDRVVALLDPDYASAVRSLLAFPPRSAGGIMSLGFVAVPIDGTQAEAATRFRAAVDAEPTFYVYVVDSVGALVGEIDLRTLFSADPTVPVREMLRDGLVTVPPDCDQEQVAAIFARYDLTALPVVSSGPERRLLGVITADDIIDVIQEEANEDVARLTGSDAAELEKKSPVQVAKLRLPWILSTMLIELLAGFVIRVFNPTLEKYLLLASFMPIISAISGNTGLQSAAIIIRGLSSGQVQLNHWKHAVLRQIETTLILGFVCAASLGVIAGIWDKHWPFGLVVFLGMFLAVNIAGVVGTVVPLLSKRAGFDPALTAGPFETAFQDVVGISIFLSLAAFLLRVLH